MACVKPEPLHLVVYMHIPPFAFQSRTNGCGERWKANLGAGSGFESHWLRFARPESGGLGEGRTLQGWGTRRIELNEQKRLK
jgi:hypothetical protein